MTREMVVQIANTVIGINKKIHGVYDKIGAARIEFAWWGGLVMQYHKHLYPGIMKRFRARGYYNEQTNTVDIGSYPALVRFLGREFRGIGDKIENREGNAAIASIQEVGKAIVDTVLHVQNNWGLLPEWEKAAIRRIYGDLYGIVSALALAIAIYAMTDDDEKNSNAIASMLYVSDRLLSESQLFTPWGAYSESQQLLSSPVAMSNSAEDLLKGFNLLAQWMFDEDFEPDYGTGLYAGQNKAWVLLKRNIPLYRTIDRLMSMTKNNSYYRINEKSLNMKVAKNIADAINPD